MIQISLFGGNGRVDSMSQVLPASRDFVGGLPSQSDPSFELVDSRARVYTGRRSACPEPSQNRVQLIQTLCNSRAEIVRRCFRRGQGIRPPSPLLEGLGGLVQGARFLVDRNAELVDHPLHLTEFLLDEFFVRPPTISHVGPLEMLFTLDLGSGEPRSQLSQDCNDRRGRPFGDRFQHQPRVFLLTLLGGAGGNDLLGLEGDACDRRGEHRKDEKERRYLESEDERLDDDQTRRHQQRNLVHTSRTAARVAARLPEPV